MVTNSSSWQDDLAEAKSFVTSTATDAGQALGLVEDDLIPGDASATGEQAEHLTKLGGAFDRAGQGFKRIDTGGWHGQAADAAHEHLSTAPPKWLKASDAFNDAGKALAEYQRVLAEMQAKAAKAKADLDRSEKASEQARNAHNARVDSFNASDRTGPRPAEFTDPAAGDRAAAQQAIEDAKAAVREAGDRAARVVIAASQVAPPEPGYLTKLKETVVDGTQAAGSVLGDFVGGAAGAVFEMGQLARLINPIDPYKITHPAESGEALATMAMGVVGAVKDPYAAAKAVVDPDGWRQNPAKNLGSMVPDALMSLAGGAGVASKVARGIGKVGKTGADVGRHADELGRAVDSPNAPRTPSAAPSPRSSEATSPSPQAQPHAPSGTPWQNYDPGQSPVSAPPQSPTSGTPNFEEPGGPDVRVGREGDGPFQRPDAGVREEAPTQAADTRPGGHREAWKEHEDFDPWEHDDSAPRHAGPDAAPHAPDPDPHGEPGRVDERPDHQSDEPRHEDPGPQREHTTDGGPHAPDPDPHGEPRHELSDEDRQTYHDRIEKRLGGDFEEHMARLRDEHPELAHLDDEKAMGVRRYVGADANGLNHTMREGDAIDREYMRPEANVLRSALDEMPRVDTTETPAAFRDIGVSNKGLQEIVERYKPGATVEEPAFTSASKDIPPAMFSQHGPDKPNKVRFIIDEPQHARDLEGTNPDEREMLWKDRNRFHVKDVTPVGDVLEVYMRDLGQGS